MAGHASAVLIGVAMGVIMGLEHTSLLALYRGGYLHDVER